jgi:serine/threonine protein kinase
VVRIVSQIARGLATAHRRGVIHRDLKPQNVLLDDDVDDPELRTDWGAVKVTDFGIAKILDDFESMTLTGNIQPGTPSFMAPEQVEGRKDLIGPATDVHALGLLMYLLLTGKNPFQADYVSKTLQRIVNDLPPPPSDLVSGIPSWLNDACLRCLEKSPGRRFPSAAELVQEFSDRAVRRSTPRASDDRTLPTTPPAAAMSHRSMWRNLGLVAAVLFLIAAVSLRLLGFPR